MNGTRKRKRRQSITEALEAFARTALVEGGCLKIVFLTGDAFAAVAKNAAIRTAHRCVVHTTVGPVVVVSPTAIGEEAHDPRPTSRADYFALALVAEMRLAAGLPEEWAGGHRLLLGRGVGLPDLPIGDFPLDPESGKVSS